MENNIVIAVHGGAQNKDRRTFTPDLEDAYIRGLKDALKAGWNILNENGTALDAVEYSVRSMEDNPMFNAGTGASINRNGETELDAAIMCGKTLMAGGVAAVKLVKNPISLARMVMEKTGHVLLCAEGAEEFAREMGVEFKPADYFVTPAKMDEKKKEDAEGGTISKDTVGAVALDKYGNLAAATSTGGLTNKMKGRIGDSPVIGSGTYANNEACAVSCTGDGEFIIRGVFAHLLYSIMKFKGWNLHDASQEVLKINAGQLRTEMGLIAIDRLGNVELAYNTLPMFRGYRKNNEQEKMWIWED